jgi:hypothetical protein
LRQLRGDDRPIYLGANFDVADAVSDGSATVELKRLRAPNKQSFGAAEVRILFFEHTANKLRCLKKSDFL